MNLVSVFLALLCVCATFAGGALFTVAVFSVVVGLLFGSLVVFKRR